MEPKLLNFFDNEINAQEIKQRLADVGIECIIQNEMKTLVCVMSESAEEGFAVYVDKKDYPKAKNIFDSYEKELEEKIKWCPECESEDVTTTTEIVKYKPRWLFILCIVLFFACIVLSIFVKGWIFIPGFIPLVAFVHMIIGYEKKSYHCNKCGHDF